MALYDEICAELQQDDELRNLLSYQITSTYYADPELRTLTIDVGFFIFRYWNKEDSTNVPLYAQPQEDSTLIPIVIKQSIILNFSHRHTGHTPHFGICNIESLS